MEHRKIFSEKPKEKQLLLPYKKTENAELTACHKLKNKELSLSRIGGEHLIGLNKKYFVARW